MGFELSLLVVGDPPPGGASAATNRNWCPSVHGDPGLYGQLGSCCGGLKGSPF